MRPPFSIAPVSARRYRRTLVAETLVDECPKWESYGHDFYRKWVDPLGVKRAVSGKMRNIPVCR